MSLTRTVRRHVPSFSLYGESTAAGNHTDPLHIEDIQSRSRKYLWNIGTHRHVGLCQCVYLVAGEVVTDLEESRTSLVGPVIIFVPPGTVHAFAFRVESQGYVLTMDLARVLSHTGVPRQASVADLFSVPHSIDLSADALLATRTAQLFESLLQAFHQPDPFRSPVVGWLACAALWILAARPGAAPGPIEHHDVVHHDLSRLWQFRQLIERHYLQHWPVQRYARRVAMSETSLNRLCQSLAGTTAFDLIQQRLALEARRRLTFVPASIASIAAELGFKDPAYFSRFFRKHSGVSPSTFRKRHEAGG